MDPSLTEWRNQNINSGNFKKIIFPLKEIPIPHHDFELVYILNIDNVLIERLTIIFQIIILPVFFICNSIFMKIDLHVAFYFIGALYVFWAVHFRIATGGLLTYLEIININETFIGFHLALPFMISLALGKGIVPILMANYPASDLSAHAYFQMIVYCLLLVIFSELYINIINCFFVNLIRWKIKAGS